MMTIHELIALTLKVPADQITDATSMKNLQAWDSLKHMELILAIEAHYKLELTGDEIADMVSVEAIQNSLKKHAL